MDLREYIQDPEEVIRATVAGLMKRMWGGAMPCIVTEDSDGHTVHAQPTIKREITDPVTGAVTYEDHPVHPDVPVQFPSAGGYTHTFPIKKGDEVMLIYAARHIDAWHQSGGNQQPMDDRMHSLGDSFCVPGIRSTPRKLNPPPSTDSAQVRTDDGKHHVEVHQQNGITLHVENGKHKVEVHPQNGIKHTSTVAIVHDAPSITYTGQTTGNLA